jgi:hypothetical protein
MTSRSINDMLKKTLCINHHQLLNSRLAHNFIIVVISCLVCVCLQLLLVFLLEASMVYSVIIQGSNIFMLSCCQLVGHR